MTINKKTVAHAGIINAMGLLLTSILKEIRVLAPFSGVFKIYLFVGLLSSAILAIYYFIDNKNKGLFDWLLYGFVLTLFISSIFSPGWRVNSLKELAVSFACVLGIYPSLNSLSVERKKLALYKSLRVIIFIVTIVSLLSVLLYLYEPYITFDFMGYEIAIGTKTNRLFGLYASLSLPIAGITVLLSLVYKNSPYFGSSKIDNPLLAISMFSNVFFVMLAYAFGTIIALAASLIYYSFFAALKSKKTFIVGLVLSLAVGALFLTSVQIVRSQVFSESSIVDNGNDDPVDNGNDDVVRPDDPNKDMSSGLFSGREVIWQFGLENLKDRPIIGFGAAAFYGLQLLGTQPLQHFHNVYVQSIVSGGLLHFSFFGAIVIMIIGKNLVYSFSRMSDKDYKYNLSIITILVFSVISGLVETNFLYVNRFPQYVFWIALGMLTFDFKSKVLSKSEQ